MQERHKEAPPPEQVVQVGSQAVHTLLEVFLYVPFGHAVRQVLVSVLKYNVPLHERHWFEAPPEQVVQEESQAVQRGVGVGTGY